MERLQKVIAASGYASRRKAEQLILQGRVRVNDEVVTTLGTKVSRHDIVAVDGVTLARESLVYYVLYKPKNMVTTMRDEHGRACVGDLFQGLPERVYPVGRLDYDSSGLLLMTNDGQFANLMMHPSGMVEKWYEVSVKGLLSGTELHQLETGVFLDGKKTLPCKIKVTHKDAVHQTTVMTVRLREGRNRQIRRMFELFGYQVTRLHRFRVGSVDLKGLTPGQYRRLTPHEIQLLKHDAGSK